MAGRIKPLGITTVTLNPSIDLPGAAVTPDKLLALRNRLDDVPAGGVVVLSVTICSPIAISWPPPGNCSAKARRAW